MAVALTYSHRTAKRLFDERAGRICVLLLIGCIGLLVRGHEMNPELAGLSGLARLLQASRSSFVGRGVNATCSGFVRSKASCAAVGCRASGSAERQRMMISCSHGGTSGLSLRGGIGSHHTRRFRPQP